MAEIEIKHINGYPLCDLVAREAISQLKTGGSGTITGESEYEISVTSRTLYITNKSSDTPAIRVSGHTLKM